MNTFFVILSSFLLFFGSPNNTNSTNTGAVKVFIQSTSDKGAFYIKVNSIDGKTDIRKVVGVDSSEQVFQLTNLPKGWYTIAVFHDVNGNGELDKNLVGAPTEPYGFSNNARGIFGPPALNEQKFYVSEAAIQTIQLE